MSIIRNMLLIGAVVSGVIILVLLFQGDEREKYLKMLGSEKTRQEAVIGFFVLKEDIVPFLSEELRKRDNSEMTDIGIVTVLGKKFNSHEDPRIAAVFVQVMEYKPLRVRKAIYGTGLESRSKEMLPLIRAWLGEDSDDIHAAVLARIPAFEKELQNDESLNRRVLQKIADIKDSPDRNVKELSGSILGREIKKKVEAARDAAANFNFVKAEDALESGRKLDPESPLINYAIGKFLLKAKKERQKGEAILSQYGFLYRVRPAHTAPRIDGDLDEKLWNESVSLQGFYRSISGDYIYRQPVTNINAYVRYDSRHLYLAASGHGNYKRLKGKANRRDGAVWRDDCCEIYIDSDFNEQSFYQIVINYKGMIYDRLVKNSSRRRRRHRSGTGWNGSFTVGTKLKQGESWSVEVCIPWETLGLDKQPDAGDVWGFNLTWVKQVKPAEYAQWCPTYGSAHHPQYFGLLVFE